MNEARLRIKTLNVKQNIFSPQDVVQCAEYSQGCDGGFPYLISGKYAEVISKVLSSSNYLFETVIVLLKYIGFWLNQ